MPQHRIQQETLLRVNDLNYTDLLSFQIEASVLQTSNTEFKPNNLISVFAKIQSTEIHNASQKHWNVTLHSSEN